MKENQTLKSIAVIIILAVIGIAIIVFNKFEFNVNYSKNVRLEINLGKSFEINDILEMANAIYTNGEAIVRKAGDYQETITITIKDYTDEQNEELINKINEKYETNLTTEDIVIYYNSNVRGSDLIKPFILSSGIAGALILMFFGIRYYKLGLVKVLGSSVGIVIGTQILYLTLTSIFRMQINEATISVGITIAMFCLMYLVATYERKLKSE